MPANVISRHRLPQPYRALLTALWIVPLALMLIAAALANSATVIDARLSPLLLALLPAAYIWREGVDVRRDALVRRIHLPAAIPYETIKRWQVRSGVLTVWGVDGGKLLECHTAHLTDSARLIASLPAHIPKM